MQQIRTARSRAASTGLAAGGARAASLSDGTRRRSRTRRRCSPFADILNRRRFCFLPGAAVPPATAGGPPAAAAAPPAAAGGPPATCRCRCCSCHCCCSTCRWRRCSSCLSAHLVDNRPFVLSSPVVALELKLAACCGILSGFATEDAARCFQSAFRGLRMSRPPVHPQQFVNVSRTAHCSLGSSARLPPCCTQHRSTASTSGVAHGHFTSTWPQPAPRPPPQDAGPLPPAAVARTQHQQQPLPSGPFAEAPSRQ